jgi:hypothetical protein
MKKNYRHGDVVLVGIDAIPVSAKDTMKIKEAASQPLAYGEVTGHSHRVVGVADVYVDGEGAPAFLEVKEESKIVHEEHGPIELDRGFYEIRQQREYRPGGWDYVKD